MSVWDTRVCALLSRKGAASVNNIQQRDGACDTTLTSLTCGSLQTSMCKLLVLALVAVVPLVSMAEELSYEKLENMEDTWANWKKQHSKVYSPREEIYRRMVFFERLISIYEHNSKYPGEHSFTLGLNQFSDMTFEEYRDYNNLKSSVKRVGNGSCSSIFSPPLNYELPDSVDWRAKGYVTPIKNQGACGAGWAFSTTGSVEGQYYRNNGVLLSLSEQQLVDCSWPNVGCYHGDVDNAFQFLIDLYNGLEKESDYPYTGIFGICHISPIRETAPVDGCVDVQSGSEMALQQAVASQGPISVTIDASHASFQNYKGGVYSELACSTTNVNHAVLVVGYGTDESGKDYWIIKNSWGPWGMKGYMLMARNSGNMCGIATQASYPT